MQLTTRYKLIPKVLQVREETRVHPTYILELIENKKVLRKLPFVAASLVIYLLHNWQPSAAHNIVRLLNGFLSFFIINFKLDKSLEDA